MGNSCSRLLSPFDIPSYHDHYYFLVFSGCWEGLLLTCYSLGLSLLTARKYIRAFKTVLVHMPTGVSTYKPLCLHQAISEFLVLAPPGIHPCLDHPTHCHFPSTTSPSNSEEHGSYNPPYRHISFCFQYTSTRISE